jgi:hypothetical protein
MKHYKLWIILALPLAASLGGCEKDEPELCGNGRHDVGETCDGSILAAQTCVSLGFAGGNLACNATCDGFDTSMCVMSICGNGVKEPGEVCDGDDFGGNTCVTLAQGFTGGELGCSSNCSELITTGCLLPDLGYLVGQVSVDAGVTCDASATMEDCTGDVYVSLFRNDPDVFLNQVPLASTMVMDAALSGDASEVSYLVENIPVGTWYLVAFLDDDDNAELTAQQPDLGDPLVQIYPVVITADSSTLQDIELTARKE